MDEEQNEATYIARIDGSTSQAVWSRHKILKEEEAGSRAYLTSLKSLKVNDEYCLFCAVSLPDLGQAKLLQIDGDGNVVSSASIASQLERLEIVDFTFEGAGMFLLIDQFNDATDELRFDYIEIS